MLTMSAIQGKKLSARLCLQKNIFSDRKMNFSVRVSISGHPLVYISCLFYNVLEIEVTRFSLCHYLGFGECETRWLGKRINDNKGSPIIIMWKIIHSMSHKLMNRNVWVIDTDKSLISSRSF